jgi:hypothetical protein
MLAALAPSVPAATITVNNANGTGAGSLHAALGSVQAGDTIAFNIAGSGPHVIPVPAGGFPLITKNNVTIDGYTQPGSKANSAGILEANNAQIKIVLDARNGNTYLLDYAGDTPNDQTGYGDEESCVLGVYAATNAVIRGLSILSLPTVTGPAGQEVSAYGISFAKGGSGQVSGCWIGVHPDGTTLAAPVDGITGFRYRRRDENNVVLQDVLVRDVVVGVPKNSANPAADFNVFCGIPAIPVIIEGENLRFCGNFFNVFPSGMQDYNPALAEITGTFEGNIEIGRGGNNTVIGVDGDGVNDSYERNVFSGVVPESLGGYDHNVEFYGQTPGTNIVVAGNYFGIAIDGATRFTNGVPALNAAGGSAEYRFGSNFDGVSDDLEANRVANNWPADLFPPSDFGMAPQNLNFFDELSTGASLSARGNVFINNFPFPASPLKTSGATTFLEAYYAKALVDPATGVVPTIDSQSTGLRLKGTVPVANAEYPVTVVDVYVADAEGLQTGIDAAIPELPDGFIQGRQYVASFVEGGPADLNPAKGAFEFNIAGLGGGKLTITANYSKQALGTTGAKFLTSPFSVPVAIPFVPGNAESAGLARVVPDRIIYNTDTPNKNNWEPNSGVIGTGVFVVEANTFADDGTTDNQRYALALQPVTGGSATLVEGFYADNGTPHKTQINLSRQDGNPGRVAGDRRPGAVNYIVGGEASPHGFEAFRSDNRWTLGFDRLDNGRYGTIQTFALNPTTLAPTPLSKAIDSAHGRRTTGGAFNNEAQMTRFGGEVVCLDDGNFVSMVQDNTRTLNPDGTASVFTIFRPDGSVVKEATKVANGDIWSNLAAFQGGFVVRTGGILYFFDNSGNATGTAEQAASAGDFDTGRGDGTRIAAHINSPYVFLAGVARSTPRVVRVAAWDARTRTFVALAQVSESGLLDASADRVNLSCDALNRVTVAYETKIRAEQEQYQTLLRVLELKPAARQFQALTPSFFAFVNFGDSLFRTIRPTVAMTTKQILVAAKGEINTANNVAAGADSLPQTTFYTVISHPDPKDDPTTPAGGGAAPKIMLARTGNNLTITSDPQPLPAGWVLQVAESVTGPWLDQVGANTPVTVPIDPQASARYLRAIKR